MKILIASLLAFLLPINLSASDKKEEKRVYQAERVSQRPPVIDGYLNDSVWQQAPIADKFIQTKPHEKAEPTEQTSFQIAYDEKNLYVAIRAYDLKADKITRRVARRDQGHDSDMVGVIIDSYHDSRTAFEFSTNAAGVKMDAAWSNNGDNQDRSWDPVWFVNTSIDSSGWTAEMRIPFSQLRFSQKDKHIWGLEVYRMLYRKQEISMWQFIPQDAPGVIHLFGELRGLRNISTPRRVELLPYSVSRMKRFKKEFGNPFAPGQLTNLSGGLDGKIGITSDLTLDFTINPDFGQVEADPSQVNLTAFETYFEEKRPFFIEGRNIFDYRLMIGDGDFARDMLFYSRRIGRSPRYSPELNDHEFAKMPDNTSILGALKLSGKTQNGFSIGILDAVTGQERAEIDQNGARRFETVEPLANYFISRLQKDFRKGRTRIGGMFTATHRNINQPHLNFLNRSAYTGGLDFHHEWHNRTYFLDLRTAFSHIIGSQEAILRAQTASSRYFQRPDASYLKLDSSRTSLTGHGGFLTFGRFGNGHWRFAIGTAWRSPGLELNDVGFIRSVDKIMQFSWVGFRIWEPFSIFRSINVNLNQWGGWNFGGEKLFSGGNINANAQFRNYWRFGLGINIEGGSLDMSALRGGPALLAVGALNQWYNLNSDERKAFQFGIGGFNRWNNDKISQTHNFRLNFLYRLGNALTFSMNPFYVIRKSNLQYIQTLKLENDTRYLFALLHQKTLGIVFRFNYSLTPNLSLQYYGQPFVSAGKYSNFKKITRPRAEKYADRFHAFSPQELDYDPENKVYSIDEGQNGAVDYSFGNPDFNFKQFRSNLVIRWEYQPGSTLFLVWSQERTRYENFGDIVFEQSIRDLFNVFPQNVFLIKFNRWFSL